MKRLMLVFLSLALCLVCVSALAEEMSVEEAVNHAIEVAALPNVDADISRVTDWSVFVEEEERQCVVIGHDEVECELFSAAFLWDGELKALQVPDVWQYVGEEYSTTLLGMLLTETEQQALHADVMAWVTEVCPAAAAQTHAWTWVHAMEIEGRAFFYLALAENEDALYDADAELVAMIVVEKTPEGMRVEYFNRNHGSLYSHG